MNREAGNSSQALQGILSPYLEFDGIDAAMLVSTDGLLIASAGNQEYDREALAAYSAAALSAAVGLAEELDTDLSGSVTLELAGNHLTLTPLTVDLFLLLMGSR
ncbi:MAG: roadblock/LC7 domain-containing protein [Actinobacteria bacterium]|nr:roadblock/LC7 domain-containing protein [Actinomycetota bacterium]